MFLSGERLLTMQIVAKRLDKDVSTICRLIQKGILKGIKTSPRGISIRERDYNDYLQKLNNIINY